MQSKMESKMKPTIKLEWRNDDDTHVVTNEAYDAAYDMLKLDMLQDSIFMLREMYAKEFQRIREQQKSHQETLQNRENKNV